MRLLRRLKNLVYWFPVIWRDRDWDYGFLLKLIRHKLAAMERCFASADAVSADAGKLASDMHDVVTCLDKYLADDFCAERFAAHVERWGAQVLRRAESAPGKPRVCEFCYSKATSPEQERQAFEEGIAIAVKADKASTDTLNAVFETLRTEVETWWD